MRALLLGIGAAALLIFGATAQDRMERWWREMEMRTLEQRMEEERKQEIQDRIYRAQQHQACYERMAEADKLLHEIAAQHMRYEVDVKVGKKWRDATKKVGDCLR